MPTSTVGIRDCQQLLELSSDTTGAWTPDSDSELEEVEVLAESERYQIHVLLDDDVIP